MTTKRKLLAALYIPYQFIGDTQGGNPFDDAQERYNTYVGGYADAISDVRDFLLGLEIKPDRYKGDPNIWVKAMAREEERLRQKRLSKLRVVK